MKRWIGRLGLGVTLSLAMFGCAQEREPINRVQANALQKSFFVGELLMDPADDPEFYYRGTVVDVGYGASQDGLFTSTYAQPISRIKWEVTEGMLTARLSYERIDQSDGKAGTTKMKEGQIVAAFPITSHFDIRRSYNPSTGEELNVIEENMSDRPWYEREYFRVDWSRNQVTDAYDFDTLSMMGVYGGIQYEPLSYYVDDPTHPDAPYFTDGYFDITQRVLAAPQQMPLPEALKPYISGDTFPACMLDADIGGGSAPAGNCNPVELKLRLSFKRVVDTDYEPMDWDGVRFQAFGAFAFPERYGYVRNYGMVDQKWFRPINRYNFWQKSHAYDGGGNAILCGLPALDERCDSTSAKFDPYAHCTPVDKDPRRDEDKNGTDDECEQVSAVYGPGSKCDVYTNKCTLPYGKRETRTITWYIHMPEDERGNRPTHLWDPVNWATEEWDVAFRAAVQAARYTECVRTQTKNLTDAGSEAGKQVAAACKVQFPLWEGQQDDQDDAIAVARHVNACRRQNGWNNPQCDAVADDVAARLKGVTPKPVDAAFNGGSELERAAAAIAAIAKQPNMLVLCHNPVDPTDNPACGSPGMAVRFGDLRYDHVNIINTPQTPSAWGIMTDADDPVTGERVSANINVWNHVTDLAAQGVVDIARYINGELTTEQVTNGTFIRDWVAANQPKNAANGVVPSLKRDEVIDRLAGTKLGERSVIDAAFNRHLGLPSKQIDAKIPQLATKVARKDLVQLSADVNQPSTNGAKFQARMASARGTDFEAQLVNRPMLQAAGFDGDPSGGQVAAAAVDMASPFAYGNVAATEAMRRLKHNAFARHGGCILEGEAMPEFSSIVGLADKLKAKFGAVEGESANSTQARVNKMKQYIARHMTYAVIAHEMGHSVALRHNFVSSYDAFTFRPQYWQLRTRNGTQLTPCADARTPEEAAACVGPRYFDPVTDEETAGMIWMWQQSTVMDYPGDVTVDFMGLGPYDFAATRMFYGDVTSVYSNPEDFGLEPNSSLLGAVRKVGNVDVPVGNDIVEKTDNFGGLIGITMGAEHYSQIQKNYNVIRDCTPVDPLLYKKPNFDESVEGTFDEVLDGHVVTVTNAEGQKQVMKCRQHRVDYVQFRDLSYNAPGEGGEGGEGASGGGDITGARGPNIDPQGRLRVPYSFASDNRADIGNASVFRHDQGADPYEQVMFWVSSHETRHVFDHYRRNRTTFAIRPTYGRDYGRYTEKMMNMAKGMALYHVGMEVDGPRLYNPGSFQGFPASLVWSQLAGDFLAEPLLAASIAMDHFTRHLTRPVPGGHFQMPNSMKDTTLYSKEAFTKVFGVGEDRKTAVVIPNGASGYFRAVGLGGQPIHNDYDDAKGDYAVSYMTQVGSYYQKIWAVKALTDSEDRFVNGSPGDFSDGRWRSNSMADLYPDGFRRLIANSLTNDREMLGPRVSVNENNKIECEGGVPDSFGNCDGFPTRPIGWNSYWYDDGPRTCWAFNGSYACGRWENPPEGNANPLKAIVPASSRPLDPQIGWEVQKYIIAWVYLYLVDNQRPDWFDMMRIFRSSDESDPNILGAQVVFRDPNTGLRYFARSYGKETLFGKTVEKGIAARVLEYANTLASKAYALDKTQGSGGFDPNTGELFYQLDANGLPIVAPDSSMVVATGLCDGNRHCVELKEYKSVIDYMLQAAHAYGIPVAADDPLKGTY